MPKQKKVTERLFEAIAAGNTQAVAKIFPEIQGDEDTSENNKVKGYLDSPYSAYQGGSSTRRSKDYRHIEWQGLTPLMLAVKLGKLGKLGDYNMAKALCDLTLEGNVAFKNDAGESAPLIAAAHGQANMYKLLIESNPIRLSSNPVEYRKNNPHLLTNQENESALQVAARHGNTAVMEYILTDLQSMLKITTSTGLALPATDINYQGSGKKTAIQIAAESGQRKAIRLLYDRGAEKNANTLMGTYKEAIRNSKKYDGVDIAKLVVSVIIAIIPLSWILFGAKAYEAGQLQKVSKDKGKALIPGLQDSRDIEIENQNLFHVARVSFRDTFGLATHADELQKELIEEATAIRQSPPPTY